MEMREIKVDILMATYNGEKYIKQQLDSILNQTYANFNIIIADDKSTDSTLDILLDYQKLDSRISVVQNEQNLGVIKNFEQLITLSTAEYFMLCDQDDVWKRNKIRESLTYITENEALLVYSDLVVVDKELREISKSYWGIKGIKPMDQQLWKLTLMQNVVTGCTIIASKSLKDFAMPFPKHIAMHDWWLAFVASAFGKVVYINEPLIYYRQHEENVVGIYDDRLWNSENKTYEFFLNRRRLQILNNIKTLTSCLERLGSKDSQASPEIIKSILELVMIFRGVTDASFSINMKYWMLKVKYPSIGIMKNIWWTLFYNFPFSTYFLSLILSRKKRIM